MLETAIVYAFMFLVGMALCALTDWLLGKRRSAWLWVTVIVGLFATSGNGFLLLVALLWGNDLARKPAEG